MEIPTFATRLLMFACWAVCIPAPLNGQCRLDPKASKAEFKLGRKCLGRETLACLSYLDRYADCGMKASVMEALKPQLGKLPARYAGMVNQYFAQKQKSEASAELVELVRTGGLRAARPERAKRLLESGADPNATLGGVPIVVHALVKFSSSDATALWEAGARPEPIATYGKHVLRASAYDGYVPAIRYCLERDVPVDSDEELSDADQLKAPFRFVQASALSNAVMTGRVEATKILLSAGADPNRASRGREPPIVLACYSGWGHEKEIVELLLGAGAKPTSEALNRAVRSGHGDVVDILLRAGVQVTDDVLARSAAPCGSGALLEMQGLIEQRNRGDQLDEYKITQYRGWMRERTNGRCDLWILERLIKTKSETKVEQQ